MKIGVSTACLYPMETEKSLMRLSEYGIKNVEIFFNADCELKGSIFAQINKIVNESGISVLSVHPYTSAVETMSLFGDYPRRYMEMMDTYKLYFEIMNKLGAKIFVLHGALKSAAVKEELYFERYSALYELGERYGVIVAQENVSYCKGGSRRFLAEMKKSLGEKCGFVLDVKQALRSGSDPFELIDLLGKSIKHCHISDNTEETDCVPVGRGRFDFPMFSQKLKKLAYDGDIVLELYRNGFDRLDELKDSVEFMESFF